MCMKYSMYMQLAKILNNYAYIVNTGVGNSIKEQWGLVVPTVFGATPSEHIFLHRNCALIMCSAPSTEQLPTPLLNKNSLVAKWCKMV